MIVLLRRDFVVGLPLERAWSYLARVEEWPRWASHIRRISLEPPGVLTPNAEGRIHLRNGIRSMFRVTEFNSYRNWEWTGRFLWLAIHYDHRFEAVSSVETRLTWIVSSESLRRNVIDRIFAAVYAKTLDVAIRNLVRLAEEERPPQAVAVE